MLEQKSNVALIDTVLGNEFSTEMELVLADRLHGAINELDRLCAAMALTEAVGGANT